LEGLVAAITGMGETMANTVADAIAVQRAPAPDRSREPKAKEPSVFDPAKAWTLPTWEAECNIYFQTSPSQFRTDRSKVLFAGAYLGAHAKTTFQKYFEHDAQPPFINDYSDFLYWLKANYGLKDPQANYENELRKLSMGDRDKASAYTAKFRAIAANLDDWSDRTLRNAYYMGVTARIRTQFVTAGRVPPSLLEPLIEACEQFDTAYWADAEIQRFAKDRDAKTGKNEDAKAGKTGKAAAPSTSTPQPNRTKKPEKTPRPATSTTAATPSTSASTSTLPLGADGRLTSDERARRIKNDLCLYCGGKGHKSIECPKRKASASAARTETPTARATISIEPENPKATQ
jgi:hypothetical protein